MLRVLRDLYTGGVRLYQAKVVEDLACCFKTQSSYIVRLVGGPPALVGETFPGITPEKSAKPQLLAAFESPSFAWNEYLRMAFHYISTND